MYQKLLENLLVSLQFGCLAVLTWLAWGTWPLDSGHGVTWVLLALSGALGVWALLANRPGNFNIRPTPHHSGHLVQHGPYHWIRHPMYSAVLLLAAALAWPLASLLAWLVWVVLALVLLSKALLEERWMTQKHPGYAAYLQRSRRFIPFVI
jgi:protein-S-isoprenylcysteine O-methyltransferase Ste14